MNSLQELVDFFQENPGLRSDVDKLVASELAKPWTPNVGPQMAGYYSKADILLFGGSAGGGKSELLCGLALTQHYYSVIYRRSFVDLAGIERRLLEIHGTRQGYNGQDMALRLPSGGVIEMGALEKPGAEASAQGRPRDLILFDEVAQLPEAKVTFVSAWLRSTRPGQRKRIVMASNPPMGGEGEWLMSWFAPWLDPLFPDPAGPGELRWAVRDEDGHQIWVPRKGFYVFDNKADELPSVRDAHPPEVEAAQREQPDSEAIEALSYTFVPSMLDDNPYLRGTGYRKQLQSLPEPMRSQLLKGDFLAGRKDDAWQVIPSAWIKIAQERWEPGKDRKGGMVSLGVDVAQGGADNTTLAPLYSGNYFGEVDSHKGVDTKDGPSVAALIVKKVRNKANIAIDLTGGWGGSARQILKDLDIEAFGVVFSAGSNARTKDTKFTFLNARAELWWKFREALDPENDERISLPPDRVLAAQLTAPRWHLRGENILIEQKEDIRKRLGSSTDKADAVIMAWHRRVRTWDEMARRPGEYGVGRYREDTRTDVA